MFCGWCKQGFEGGRTLHLQHTLRAGNADMNPEHTCLYAFYMYMCGAHVNTRNAQSTGWTEIKEVGYVAALVAAPPITHLRPHPLPNEPKTSEQRRWHPPRQQTTQRKKIHLPIVCAHLRSARSRNFVAGTHLLLPPAPSSLTRSNSLVR